MTFAVTIPDLKPSDLARFWKKVNKTEGCWVWTAATVTGYGSFSIGPLKSARRFLAHRVSYVIANGPVPDGLTVSHLCHNRPCVRPDHLVAESMTVNLRRSMLGSMHHQAKLTDDDVRAIRHQLSQGRTQRAIARDFNISQNMICLINRRRNWAHLED